MIHAFAIEPRLVATWGAKSEHRYIADKFGLGTPRVLLELPEFPKWRAAVIQAANQLGVSDKDGTRLVELLKMFSEHRHRRPDAVYDEMKLWLDNAEGEFGRRPFAGILATENPRSHNGVLTPDQLDPSSPRWACASSALPRRTPKDVAAALTPMLTHCRKLHLIDPYFAPSEPRFNTVLAAILDVLVGPAIVLDVIRVHCAAKGLKLADFESDARKMAALLPNGVTVEFVRWAKRRNGEHLHNRYVLTDIGGVSFGIGLDADSANETDDMLVLPRLQYDLRWNQYVGEKGFFCVDRPAAITGTRR